MKNWVTRTVVGITIAMLVGGCAVSTGGRPPASPSGSPQSPGRAQPSGRPVDPAIAARLQQVMVPLIRNMSRPIPLNQVRVGIMADPHINAANAGGGEFYVTTGLLERANDGQLRAVMAHEIAHADLGHFTKLRTLGAGLNIGMILLDQLIPGSRVITPLAGQLIANAYTRKEEYEADSHGVDILRRAGYDGKALMVNTLSWLKATEGSSGGGFFATHPETGDRIQALQPKR